MPYAQKKAAAACDEPFGRELRVERLRAELLMSKAAESRAALLTKRKETLFNSAIIKIQSTIFSN